LQTKATPPKVVLLDLRKRQAKETNYETGKVLCSMCTKPHIVAKKAHELFFESNLGDPRLFQETAQLEREVIAQLGNLLHQKSATGFIVSGGTEANMLALLTARNASNISSPEVVLPDSAHFSLQKACNLLNLKPVIASLDESYIVKPSEVEKLVNKNTIAIVGTAGTSELGTIDPIHKLSEIAVQHKVHLHVDAAFGGLIIPFLKTTYPFDFQLQGVSSMTVDPHKMGMSVIPGGGILFRNSEMLQYIKTETPYISAKSQYTFVGTRSGASIASVWAVFKTLGKAGFTEIVEQCVKNTSLLVKELKKYSLSLLCQPTLNIVSFRSNKNTNRLSETLWRKGWFVSYIPRYDCIRIIIMPHVKKKHVLKFIEVVKEIEML
jgi:tyrosine decarboxylase/aspartate 1-decarboxylase